jgi:hypothetical protein
VQAARAVNRTRSGRPTRLTPVVWVGPDAPGDPEVADVELLLIPIFVLIPLGLFALWIWSLVDVLRTPDPAFRTGTQLIWVIVIVFATVVGSIVYLAIGRPASRASGGPSSPSGGSYPPPSGGPSSSGGPWSLPPGGPSAPPGGPSSPPGGPSSPGGGGPSSPPPQGG